MQNYANDIVAELKDACGERQLPAPTLISESGRAIASHQSVLIFDVLSTCDVPPALLNHKRESPQLFGISGNLPPINVENYQETYHDVTQFKEEAISRFRDLAPHRASQS